MRKKETLSPDTRYLRLVVERRITAKQLIEHWGTAVRLLVFPIELCYSDPHIDILRIVERR